MHEGVMPGRRTWAGALALAAALLLAACGQPDATPSPPAVPSASPTPQPIIGAVDRGGATDKVRLLTLDGQELAATQIPAGSTVAGVAGDKVMWLEGATLKGMDKSGKVTQVAALPAVPSGPVTLRPDGTGWAWTRSEAQGAQTHSVLYVDDRPLIDSTEPGHELQPVVWTARGIVIQHATLGLGGYIPIGGVTGRSELLNPQTGTRRPLTDEKCLFLDLATDGTLACRTPASGLFGARSIQLVRADGTKTEIQAPGGDRLRFAGDASFKPELQTTQMAIGASSGASATTSPPGVGERYETDILDVGTATLRQFGPAGLQPGAGSWAWLPGSWLLAWRAPGAGGGDPGIYVIALTGAARQITPTGQPVGVILGGGGGGGAVV
jgi:hypothetical protein